MESEQKNIFLAIALSIFVFVGFNYFFSKPAEVKSLEANPKVTVIQNETTKRVLLDRGEALSVEPHISFENDNVQGSLNLKSGMIDDLLLKHYKETTDEKSPLIQLLSPFNAANTQFLGLYYNDKPEIQWQTEQSANRNEINLTHENDVIIIKRHIGFDNNYVITVTDSIKNKKDETLTITPKTTIVREHKTSSSALTHEGIASVINGKLKETSFAKIKNEKITTQDGWIGFTDKYWMSSVFIHGVAQIQTNAIDGIYTLDISHAPILLKPHDVVTYEQRFFAGAKELHTLEKIRDMYKIKNFDAAIDFGWFYFLTQPLLKVLTFFYKLIGNFGLAIIVVTLLSKILLFPLALKSHRSMMAMKKIQPQIAVIRERNKDDKMKQHMEIMKLYKEKNVKPMSGCLPLLLQIPVLFFLYKVLSISIEMRHAPFFGWIHDLSAPDPTSFFNLFGLLPFAAPAVFAIGIWPLLMGVTMYLQQKIMPQMSDDPSQQKVMMFLPIIFTYMFASSPVGLVLYWTWSNVLTIIQQWLLMRYVK